MPIFSYKAKNRKGKNKRGITVAINESDAVKQLKRRGLFATYIKDSSDALDYKLLSFLNPVSGKDLVIFSRQFSVMVKANVPIVEALITIIDQTDNIKFKNIISKVAYDVDSGMQLSDALKKFPDCFSDFYCNIIKAGETSGKLDEVTNYLAAEMEKDYDLTKRFKGALIYPLFVITGLLAVGLVFLFFVLPEMTKILEETGAQLPLPTRIVIAATEFLQKYYISIIIFLISSFIALKLFFKSKVGRNIRDVLLVSLPVLGKILQLIYLTRFSRSLGTLLRGGVPIIKSLDIVGDVVRNSVYKNVISLAVEDIKEGGSMVEALENSRYVPKMVPSMVLVGERTGSLDEVLEAVAKFYDKEVSNKLANLNTLLEPIIMVIMGIGVGIMVAAIILPMYNMASQF